MYPVVAYISISCVVSSLLAYQSENVSYVGAQLWRTRLRTDADRDVINNLDELNDISLWKYKVKSVDFLVSKADKQKVHRFLRSHGLNHTVLIEDVQSMIEETAIHSPDWDESLLRVGHRMDWRSYPTVEVISEYFRFIAENFPAVSKVETIGQSFENRPIKMVKISNGNPENKVIVITAGMHAREWAAVTSAFYIINEIVTGFDHLPGYMKNKDWYIVPLVNPDGYKYTHTHDRLWRKNRRKLMGTDNSCIGVDINRNFGFDWSIGNYSAEPCKSAYRGDKPFSEPEAQAIRGAFLRMKKKPSVYIDIHSYGQLILHSWGAREAPQDLTLSKHAKGMAEEIKKVTNQVYGYGSILSLMYITTGSAIDWFYNAGVPVSVGIEGRDKGYHGFLLPPEDIVNAAKDSYAAVKHAGRAIDPSHGVRMRGTERVSWFK